MRRAGHAVQIGPLADHPEWIEAIGRWHWDEWGHEDPSGSRIAWTRGIAQRTRRDSIPTSFAASRGGEPIGAVILVEHDMEIRPDLSPWLSGLYVVPGERRAGVGAALVSTAVARAAELGVEKLFLYTNTAQSLYARLGWRAFDTAFYDGLDVTLMEIKPRLL